MERQLRYDDLPNDRSSRVDFCGVVVTREFPRKTRGDWISKFHIIDDWPDADSLTWEDEIRPIVVQVFHSENCCPDVVQVGSVVKLRRFLSGSYQGYPTLTVSGSKKGSWSITVYPYESLAGNVPVRLQRVAEKMVQSPILVKYLDNEYSKTLGEILQNVDSIVSKEKFIDIVCKVGAISDVGPLSKGVEIWDGTTEECAHVTIPMDTWRIIERSGVHDGCWVHIRNVRVNACLDREIGFYMGGGMGEYGNISSSLTSFPDASIFAQLDGQHHVHRVNPIHSSFLRERSNAAGAVGSISIVQPESQEDRPEPMFQFSDVQFFKSKTKLVASGSTICGDVAWGEVHSLHEKLGSSTNLFVKCKCTKLDPTDSQAVLNLMSQEWRDANDPVLMLRLEDENATISASLPKRAADEFFGFRDPAARTVEQVSRGLDRLINNWMFCHISASPGNQFVIINTKILQNLTDFK